MAANSPYRDNQGRFIPKYMPADEANRRDIGNKYGISDNYKGKEGSAIGTRLGNNPHEFKGHTEGHPAHTKTGEKPPMTTADQKYPKWLHVDLWNLIHVKNCHEIQM